MIRSVFFAAMAVVSVACLQSTACAALVISSVSSVTGGATSKTVTININAVSDGTLSTPPAFLPGQIDNLERAAFYHFRVDLTGSGITGLSAVYDTGSVWSGLAPVDLNGVQAGDNPGISGNSIVFKAGGATNLAIPTSNSFVGTITFTTTVNGSFGFSITPLDTSLGGGTAGQNTTAGLLGFAHRANPSGFAQLNQNYVPANIVVSGIVAVPEPSSILLIGFVLAGCGGLHLRRRIATAKP
jgi:PEP-CTERM motif